jgi:apolipoprotein N-acyltransferase
MNCFWQIFGPAALALWLILAVWIALFVALARLCFLQFRPVWAVILIPLIWTGLEYFRSELYYLRFSWLNVGYVFSGSGLLPLLGTLGMYGVGFAAMAIAAALTACHSLWARVTVAAVAALLVASSLLPGRMMRRQLEITPGKEVEVAAVQLEFANDNAVISALDHLLKTAPERELLVLSEYTFDGPVPEAIKLWCHYHRRYLIVGGKDPARSNKFYDTAFVIGPNGEILFRQAKAVPIQFFNDGLPAPAQALWESPWGKIGICICYDLSYTRVTDRLIRLGAEALIVPTMDVADWGRHEHELHARVAPVRATEYRVPVFRVASSGISQLVDATGQVTASAPFPGELAVVSGRLHFSRPGTLPFDRWLAPVASCITAGLIIWFSARHWRNQSRLRSHTLKAESKEVLPE